MPGSYSVEAILSAKDNMSSVFNRAAGSASSFGGRLKSALGSGIAMGVGMKAVSAATNALTSNLDGAIKRYDTLNQFPKMMKQIGFGTKEANAATEKMKASIEGLPTSLNDITKSTQSLALLTGDLEEATDLSIALNDAFLASGSSAEDVSRGLTQYSQMLSAGKVDMQSWKTLLETMSPALTEVANSFGFTGKAAKNDLYEALKEGDITFDEFNDKLIELDGRAADTGKALSGFSKKASISTKGIATNIQNLKTKIVSGLEGSIRAIDKALKKNNLPTIAEMFQIAKDKIGDSFDKINEKIETLDFKKIAKVAGSAFETLGKAATIAGKLVSKAITLITEHADTIATIGKGLLIVALAFKAMTIVSTIASGISTMVAAFTALVPAASAAAPATTAAGNAARVSASGFMKAGVGILAIGAGLALAAVGFALLTQSAIALANAGGPAVAILGGMVVAIGGLIAVAGLVGPALTAGAVGMLAFGAAMIGVGAGIAIACAGISLLDGVILALGQALPPVITAIGQAFMMLGQTILMVATGIATVITAIGQTVTSIFQAIASVFTSIGQAAISAGMGFTMIAMGIERLVALPLGDLATTLATTAAGLRRIASAGQGLSTAASSMVLISAGIARISSSGSKAASAIVRLKTALMSLAVLASGVGKAVGSQFASGIASGMSKGAAVATASAKKIIASLKAVSTQAKASGAHAGQGFTNGFKTGVSPAVNVASSIMGKIIAKFNSGVAKARSTGYSMGAGLASGMESAAGRCERAAARIVAAAAKAANAAAKVHSPSRVTMRTGRMMALGLAVGLKKGTTKVQKAAVGLVKKINAIMETALIKHNFSDIANKALDKFTKRIQKRTEKLEKGLKKTVNKTFSKVMKKVNGKKLTKSLKGVKKIIKKKFTKALRKEMREAIRIADEKLTELADKYQKAYDEILSHKNTFYEKMTDYGKLYSSDSYGFMIFKDFRAATAQLEVLRKNLKQLQSIGVSYDFMNEITQMDTASQIEYTNALLAKGADFAKEQSDAFDEMLRTATSISDEIYQPYINELDANYNSELAQVMSDLETQFSEIGKNAAKGLIKSLNDKKTKKKLKQVSKGLADLIVKQIKKSLKIKSPSRVMASLGNYTGEGLALGIDQMRRDVALAAQRLVQIPEVAVAGAYSGSLSSEYDYYRQAEYTVIVPVDLDGKEVARVTAPYMEDDLNKIQRRRDRRNGNL